MHELMQTYNGVDIYHDWKNDKFFCSIKVITGNKEHNLENPRLQKLRESIDGFLATNKCKEGPQKVIIRDQYTYSVFENAFVVFFNTINKDLLLKNTKDKQIKPELDYNREGYKGVFVHCKENLATMATLKPLYKKVDDLKAQIRTIESTLIPIKIKEHFLSVPSDL